MNKKQIAEKLYKALDYPYCSDCRYNIDDGTGESACVACLDGSPAWAISKDAAEKLAEMIAEDVR